jgi:hypothetical protein
VKQPNTNVTFCLCAAGQNNAFLVVLEQISDIEVDITFQNSVRDYFEYLIFNRDGNAYSYPLQGLALVTKDTTTRGDSHHVLLASIDKDTQDVITFTDS